MRNVMTYHHLVVLLRSSTDNGVSWTSPRVITPQARYQRRNQVIAGTSIAPDGLWLQACDATPGGEGSSALHISRDGGRPWSDPGGDIRGTHAGAVGLRDGHLLALGRAQPIEGRMPMSLSSDSGKSWPVRRVLTPGDGAYDGGAWTGGFVASPVMAEPKGYLAATQPPDGIIHLISSRLHYRFTLAWLLTTRFAGRE